VNDASKVQVDTTTKFPLIHLYFRDSDAHAAMIRHLLSGYLNWFGLEFRILELSRGAELEAGQLVIAYGNDIPAGCFGVSIPVIPEDISDYKLLFEKHIFSDWFQSAGAGRFMADADPLSACAGMLYRHAELDEDHYESACLAKSAGFPGATEGLFDVPVADRFIVTMLSELLGESFKPQARARWWLSFDIDSLRKWRPLHWLRHLLLLPYHAMALNMIRWFKGVIEAFRSISPLKDPYMQIPDLVDVLGEEKACFFFLGLERDHFRDRYDIREAPWRTLPFYCLKNGHDVGVHGNPLHAESAEGLRAERDRLAEVLDVEDESLSLTQKQRILPTDYDPDGDQAEDPTDGGNLSAKALNHIRCNRQHYLRWLPDKTMKALAEAGFKVDSSVAWNDRPGFRSGTAIPYVWWDLDEMCEVPIVEMPLILGDFQLHSKGHKLHEPWEHFIRMWEQTSRWGGVFTWMFHNVYFHEQEFPEHKAFFLQVLEHLQQHSRSTSGAECFSALRGKL